MKEHSKGPRHRRVAGQPEDTKLSLPRGLIIEPPPKKDGPERLYRVVYVIDVSAMSPQQAAEHAHEIMRDPESMRPVLDVLDGQGRRARVDLSEE